MRALLTFLFLVELICRSAFAATLEWLPTGEPGVAGYRAYIGTSSRSYSIVHDVSSNTFCPLDELAPGVTYYLAATAYDAEGLESDFSAEVTYNVPPLELQLVTQTTSDLTNWSSIFTNTIAMTNTAAFFRVQLIK